MRHRLELFIVIVLLWGGCRGTSQQKPEGGSCKAETQESGDVLISCDDGSSGLVRKTPPCEVQTAGADTLLRCPPATEWVKIPAGLKGDPGEDCRIIAVANSYVSCDAANRQIVLLGDSGKPLKPEREEACRAKGLAFDKFTALCRGHGETLR